MENKETRATVLEGFTITGGRAGIVVIEASPTVRGNMVTGNVTSDEGAGILAAGSGTEMGPLVIGNTAFDNQAYPVGGGIEGSYMIVDFEDNEVFNNTVTHGDGGGIMCTHCKAGSQIRGNVVHENFTVADPAFCDTTSGDWSVADNSPALTDPNGPMGAVAEPGCHGTATYPTTWGLLKQRYD